MYVEQRAFKKRLVRVRAAAHGPRKFTARAACRQHTNKATFVRRSSLQHSLSHTHTSQERTSAPRVQMKLVYTVPTARQLASSFH